jgi:hypothetical protein
MDNMPIKNYSNTYLYSQGNYEKKIFEFIMRGEQINKEDSSFDDIRYEVKKRQVASCLIKVLDSKNVILLRANEAMPRAFKVFAAKDIKAGETAGLKIFIDVTEIIKFTNGRYSYNHNDIDVLVSYLLSALNHIIYYSDPKRILMNASIIDSGANAFTNLFYYILDYMRISGALNMKEKCAYLTTLYYQINILGKELDDTTRGRALKISQLSDREAQIIDIQLDKDSMTNIKFFIANISKIFKFDKLTLEAFMDKWVYLYGTGTQFALELYPAFSTMITNAYVGAYLNNQKSIENKAGRYMVEFTKTLISIVIEAYE